MEDCFQVHLEAPHCFQVHEGETPHGPDTSPGLPGWTACAQESCRAALAGFWGRLRVDLGVSDHRG